MIRPDRYLAMALIVLPFILSACRPSQVVTTPTQPASNVVLTAAAQTAQARLTEMAAVTPSPEPTTTPSATLTMTPLPVTPTLTTTAVIGATNTPGTTGGASAGDRARYLADVTVPDGAVYTPGATLTKTWRLENAGTTTWATSYSLRFISGAKMDGPDSVPVPQIVGPGQSVEISVNLVAPSAPGNYRGYWKLTNTAGQFFDEPVYVEINVAGEGTPVVPTSTPGSSSDSIVTQASISIDNATVSGPCPHTFTFTAGFTLGSAATITHQFEAGSDTPGFAFSLPGSQSASYAAGTYTFIYNLVIESSMNGWGRLHISSPVDLASDEVAFSMTCQ